MKSDQSVESHDPIGFTGNLIKNHKSASHTVKSDFKKKSVYFLDGQVCVLRSERQRSDQSGRGTGAGAADHHQVLLDRQKLPAAVTFIQT